MGSLAGTPTPQFLGGAYEEAAQAFNRCRERGIQGSNTDFLICSAALRHDLAVYTTDKDFLQYEKVLEIALHEPRL